MRRQTKARNPKGLGEGSALCLEAAVGVSWSWATSGPTAATRIASSSMAKHGDLSPSSSNAVCTYFAVIMLRHGADGSVQWRIS